jgi:methylenetetrahydrofolate dehydrogenase (NADP+) / methenyltetrahydrofolate cyclohydrolase
MGAKILDGKALAKEIEQSLVIEAKKLKEEHNLVPSLHVVLVGDDPASQVYVKNKHRKCEKLGFTSVVHTLPAGACQDDLLERVTMLNEDPAVNGILVQLPLPGHMDSQKVMLALDPLKDVDGFHPFNLGRLLLGDPLYSPCTPQGIMELIRHTGVPIEGKEAVVLGRSTIVGKPVSFLLLHKNATVTICHSKTAHLTEVARRADILIAAIGKKEFVTGDFIKEGAVVIDVGINRTTEGSLTGDVHFESAREKASWITPVPGGVGPMTIIMLMQNTLKAAKIQKGISG